MNETNWTKVINRLLHTKKSMLEEDSEITIMDHYDSISPNASQPFSTITPSYNPLLEIPFDVRDSILNDYYENGMTSIAQKYVEEYLIKEKRYNDIQEFFNSIYFYACRTDKRSLAYNIILVLSQIEYCFLGEWASILAVAATRNKYLDVIEQGVRCFENWESIDACSFLKECSFSEQWLQEYADEVCLNIMEAENSNYVLSKEDYTWEVAFSGNAARSDLEGYRSRYSSSRFKN